MKKRKGGFACLGDSITSEQMTGIGTLICRKLETPLFGNFACGWATGSDWHRDGNILTQFSLEVPINSFCAENVLSNQVFRLLQQAQDTGCSPAIVYIAISANDGANGGYAEKSPVPLVDDAEQICALEYSQLTRTSLAGALRWAIETIQRNFSDIRIYAASPLQAYAPGYEEGALSEQVLLLKREIIQKVCVCCGITFIDSYYESGFTKEIAKNHGEVHPDTEWADRIADYVAGKISENL
ncbi:SGNH/GDSL hydrolase family protein [Blautia schinkii]|nr:SGNH/GDSL hydrolase family protein [Blautia schinkii]